MPMRFGTVRDDLLPGAHNAIDTCLGIGRGERVALVADEASREVIEIALQVFGGVAFTWEHDVHLFQRRVLDLERRFGDTLYHEALIADRLAAAGMEVLS